MVIRCILLRAGVMVRVVGVVVVVVSPRPPAEIFMSFFSLCLSHPKFLKRAEERENCYLQFRGDQEGL